MKKPQGRHAPPPTPEQIVTFPVRTAPPTIESPVWERTTSDHTLGPGRIAIGVIRHHGTRLYHAVLSLYGNDLTTVGVYATEEQAQSLAEAFGELFMEWRSRPEVESVALQAALNAEAAATSVTPPQTWLLPDTQVTAFLAEVARRVQREN